MGQINVGIGGHKTPVQGTRAYSFSSQGKPVYIDELGIAHELYSDVTVDGVSANVLANIGVGLEADLPDAVAGYTYVTTDTFKIYQGIDTGVYDISDLSAAQFVTDTYSVDGKTYQFTGTELKEISGGGSTVTICDQADVEQAEPTENTKATSALRAWQGFVYWCTATVFNGLSTSSKTIIGAINVLKSLYDTLFASVLVKQPANTGICESCPILTTDVVRDWNTRTLTIQSTKGGTAVDSENPIRFFTKTGGEKELWELSTPQSVDWSDTKGIKYIYFDTDGVLKSSDSVWAIGNITTIWRLYWNPALTGSAKIVREVWECHTNSISADDHIWKHRYGAVWLKGFDLICTVLPTGAPAGTGVNTCLSLTGGSCIDDNLQYDVINSAVSADFSQDLGNTTAANITTANAALMEITYNAPDGTLTLIPATRYPFHFVGDIPQVISAGGIITPVTNNYFFNYYVYSFQDPRFGKVLNLRSGGQYATQAEANAETWEQIKAASLTLQDGEVKQLYKTQWEYRTSYDAAVKKSVLRAKTDLRSNAAVAVTASGASTTASNVICMPPSGYASTDQQSLDNELATNTLKGNTTEHTTPVDADSLGVWDSVSSAFKRLPFLALYNFFVAKSTPPQEASELLATDVVFGGRGTDAKYWAVSLWAQKLIGYLPKDAACMAASWADVQAICESATCPASVQIHLTNDVILGALNTYATSINFSGRQVIASAASVIVAGMSGAGTYRMTFESGLVCTTSATVITFGSSQNTQDWDVRVRDLQGSDTVLSVVKINPSTCTFKYNKVTRLAFEGSTNVTATQSDMWFELTRNEITTVVHVADGVTPDIRYYIGNVPNGWMVESIRSRAQFNSASFAYAFETATEDVYTQWTGTIALNATTNKHTLHTNYATINTIPVFGDGTLAQLNPVYINNYSGTDVKSIAIVPVSMNDTITVFKLTLVKL